MHESVVMEFLENCNSLVCVFTDWSTTAVVTVDRNLSLGLMTVKGETGGPIVGSEGG